jgi:hypothetical protein
MPLAVPPALSASGQEPSSNQSKKSLSISASGHRPQDNISALHFFEAATSDGFNRYVHVVAPVPEY